MAVNPLPPSSTERYFIDYFSMGIKHTVMFRTNVALPAPATFFAAVIDDMRGNMRLADTVDVIRHAAIGSDITFPVATVNEFGVLSNSSSIADDPEAVFVSVPFRSIPQGRKGRYDFFFPCNNIPLDSDNRFPASSVSDLNDLFLGIQVLADGSEGGPNLVSIGGDRIILNSYFNRAKSAYWQRRQRRG